MNELTFKDSMSTCHKIVTDANGRRYIMDTSTLTPNVHGFGIIPKQVTVEMVEFGNRDQNFEFKAKPSSKFLGVAAVTQPLTTILYKVLESVFLKYNIHQQVLLKWMMFGLSIVLAFVLAKVYIQLAKKKVAKRVSPNAKRYIAKFTYWNKRDYSNWFMILLIAIIFYFFLKSTNGTEGILLVPITILAHLLFVFWLGMAPVDQNYNRKRMQLVSIEEKK